MSVLRITLAGLVVGRDRRALSGPIDLSLRAGGALVVTGPNGAGKSTLLRTLAGLLPPLGGAVSVSGAGASDGEPALRLADASHYLGHRNAMKPGRTVGAELAFWAAFLRRPALDVEAALAAVGLDGAGDLAVGVLSAGQQRRAAFARLLVCERPVWLLDEPTTALDAAAQARIAGLCRAHREEGGVVIAATHQPLDLGPAQSLVLQPPATPVPAAVEPGGWDEIG